MNQEQKAMRVESDKQVSVSVAYRFALVCAIVGAMGGVIIGLGIASV